MRGGDRFPSSGQAGGCSGKGPLDIGPDFAVEREGDPDHRPDFSDGGFDRQRDRRLPSHELCHRSDPAAVVVLKIACLHRPPLNLREARHALAAGNDLHGCQHRRRNVERGGEMKIAAVRAVQCPGQTALAANERLQPLLVLRVECHGILLWFVGRGEHILERGAGAAPRR